MTTFEAVSVHWPRQTKMKSTQRSRRSAKASSVHIPSSPTRVGSTPPKQAISSPRQPATRNGSLPYGLKVEVIETFDESIPPNNEDLDEDEEDNPFDILNMTQRYTEGVPEVNPSYIQRNAEPAQEEEGDDDDPDRDQQLHEQDALVLERLRFRRRRKTSAASMMTRRLTSYSGRLSMLDLQRLPKVEVVPV
jgi:hypothetical protein